MNPMSSDPDGIVSCSRSVKRIWLLAMLIAPVISVSCNRGIKEEPPVPTETKPDDQLHIPDSPAGKAIMNHFATMYAMGPDAEKNYEVSLDSLRRRLPESIQILYSAYEQLDKVHYGDRWTLVQTLADLNRTSALERLSAIANERMPRRDTVYGHEIYPYEEESVIRITALKGIGKLTATSDSAVRVIQPFISHPDTLIRQEALNSLADGIRAANQERKPILRRLLPKDYIFIADPFSIRPTGINGEEAARKPSGKGNGPAPKIQ